MLHTCYKVVCSQISHFSALGIYPLQTLTKVEGVGQAVLRNLIALCQCRLLNALAVILHQSVEGIYQRTGLGCSGACQDIPGSRICGITIVVLIFQSITFLFQVFLSLCFIGAGSFELCPFFSQCSYIFCFDEISSD